MFNTITISVLNWFLGDYLDITDLDLSLWEGEFTLNNVAIKSTAIHAFRLPYHVVAGNVGKLSVKLPWRNIYTSPVEVVLTDVHMVIIESRMVPYDQEAQEAEFLAYKMAHLKYMEDKDKELERQGSTGSASSGGSGSGSAIQVPVLTQSPSFSENLAAAILRNLTVRVESVHILYEENDPVYQPFSLGIVLSVLTLETTNEKGTRTFVPEEIPLLYKLVNLHGFGVYMNIDDNITRYGQSSLNAEAKEVIQKLGALVKDKEKVRSLNYIVGPIVTSALSAQIKSVNRPDKSAPPFSIPKTSIQMGVQRFVIVMSTLQFVNIIRLAKKITGISGEAAQAWRKYRPLVNQYKGHYKQWWRFAIMCVLSEIQTRRDIWSWKSFKAHIQHCKEYTEALVRVKLADTYTNVLLKWTNHFLPLTSTDEECIRTYEAQLNILSLMLCRKKAQIITKRHEEFARKHHSQGWLSNLYDWKVLEEHSDDLTQFLAAPWTMAEKEKLILAADFCESEEPPPDPGSNLIYPLAFIGFRAALIAKEMSVTVKDYETNADGDQILQIKISNLQTSFETRPASNGSRIRLQMKSVEVTGQSTHSAAFDDEDSNFLLKAVSTKPGQNLDICYEKFPFDSPTADEKLSLTFANAIEIVNHAATVQKIMSLISQATRPYSFYSSKMPWLHEII